MNKYQEALNTLKASDIKLCVYKEQENVIEEHQPTIFDFYHSEIFALQELINKCYQLEKDNELLKIVRKGQENRIIQLNKALDKVCRIYDEEVRDCNFFMIKNDICNKKCRHCDQEERVKLMKEWVMKNETDSSKIKL
jgi:hypothetical protein